MFCPNCGTQLPEDARFCGSCGTRIETGPIQAAVLRAPEGKGSAEGAAEGAKASGKKRGKKRPAGETSPRAPEETKAAAGPAPEQLRFDALPEGGEMALGMLGPALPDAVERIPGPLKVIGSGLKNLFRAVAAAFRDPKRLIPALALAVIWLALDLLKVRGMESRATRVLFFLTFANGGMEGGTAGLVGGLIGKGLTAGALTAVVGRFARKGESEKRGLGNTLKGGFGFSKDAIWAYLAGVGAALLLYLFFSGGALKSTFMAGLASAYLAARSALENGFLKKLFSSVASKGKGQAGPGAAAVLRGLALGFLAAALLALAEKRLLLLIPGAVLLAGGAVMEALRAAGVFRKKEGDGAENA